MPATRAPNILLTLVFASLAAAPAARPQAHDHPAGDFQALGRIRFATSCAGEVRADFDRAVAMLHSFWYPEAEEAFGEIARRDPDCAMARWGIAMSRFHPLWAPPTEADLAVARAALDEAREAEADPRERAWIEALARFFDEAGERDHLARIVAYEDAMRDLAARYPEDREAATFHALAILGVAAASPPDEALTRQREAGAILEDLFVAQPDHPGLAHYIIHSYDHPPLAEGGLEAARRYAGIAPSAPHALHMPSHIFTRLGLWQESIDSNTEAAAAARETGWLGEELHAIDYLAYAYLQGARDEEARRILHRLPQYATALTPDTPAYIPQGVFAIAAIPARYAVERRQWQEAAELSDPPEVGGERPCWAEASLDFARGLGAARLEQVADSRRSIESLEACRRALLDRGERLWAPKVEAQRRAVEAWLMLAEGTDEMALAAMRAAADLEDATDKHPVTPGAIVPARELLGEMLLELDRPEEALVEFETTLNAAPNRFQALYGAARAAEESGNPGAARAHYSKLLEIAGHADTERPELRRARDFLERSGIVSGGSRARRR